MRIAKLGSLKTIRLFLDYFLCCISSTDKINLDAASRWYVIGQERLKKELNLTRLVKSLRYMKEITLKNKEMKAQIMTN